MTAQASRSAYARVRRADWLRAVSDRRRLHVACQVFGVGADPGEETGPERVHPVPAEEVEARRGGAAAVLLVRVSSYWAVTRLDRADWGPDPALLLAWTVNR
jgi:hypothetical protein